MREDGRCPEYNIRINTPVFTATFALRMRRSKLTKVAMWVFMMLKIYSYNVLSGIINRYRQIIDSNKEKRIGTVICKSY